MPKLHELLAVMADTTNASQAVTSETSSVFTKKADHFRGHSKTVTYFDDAREGENTKQSKMIVTSVSDKLDHTFKIVGRHYDALFQLEEANGRARADLIVDGTTIMKNVPATFLLGMESRLKAVKEMIIGIPTLDPSVRWDEDKSSGEGHYRGAPVIGMKGEKTLKFLTVAEATVQHPAQVEKWNEDVPVARIETTHTSAMLTPHEKSAMMLRVDKMISAVKKARQRANTVDVTDSTIAAEIFGYIRG